MPVKIDWSTIPYRKKPPYRVLLKLLKKHIVDEFPHPDACFMCHLGDCEGCPILIGGE